MIFINAGRFIEFGLTEWEDVNVIQSGQAKGLIGMIG